MLKTQDMFRFIRHLYDRGFTVLSLFLVVLAFAFTGAVPDEVRAFGRSPAGAERTGFDDRKRIGSDAWRAEGTAWLARKSTQIMKEIRDAGIQNVAVYSRMKSDESAHEKASRRGVGIAALNDLYGMRVVVSNELDVYRCLNLICGRYPAVSGTMKNYIVAPKASGYQSVHVVAQVESRRVEFQLRTGAMHQSAEAEHEAYKERLRAA